MNEFMLNLFERIGALRKSRTFRTTAWSAFLAIFAIVTWLLAQSTADANTYVFAHEPVRSWIGAIIISAILGLVFTCFIWVPLGCWLYLPSNQELQDQEDQQ